MYRCRHCNHLKPDLRPYLHSRAELTGRVIYRVLWCWPCIFQNLILGW